MHLLVQSCFFITKYFYFKLEIVSWATANPWFWENARIIFTLKWLFCYKNLVDSQRDDQHCVEESYNEIKMNELHLGVCA